MIEPEAQSTVILWAISGVLLLLFVVTILILRLSGRLKRLENQLLLNNKAVEPQETAPSVAETSPGGAFEAFLAEDPERRSLTKGEQFSAYRKWRQEKGMNWSNS